MKRYLLFGTEVPIDEAAERLRALTGEDIKPWHSEYWGDYYATITPDPPDVQLIENAPDLEGYMPEPRFPEPPVLVYVSRVSKELQEQLAAVEWLQLLRIDDV